jgi:hypothetical protein
MVFRRIYWVTEELADNGSSRATGVFTSTSDLASRGLRWLDGPQAGFRVVLVKLDSAGRPLGAWAGPDFAGLEADLQPFVATEELTEQEIETLGRALREFAAGC